MFHLNKDIGLTYDNEVFKKPQLVFKLKADKEATYTGVLVLSNGVNITFPLQNEGLIYKGQINVSKDILPFLIRPYFFVYQTDLNNTRATNSLEIALDLPAITIAIKKELGEEIKDLSLRMAELESQLIKLSSKGILKNVPVVNKADIKPGMIPVATASGEFAAAYPFADVVKKVNGIGAINESILLTLGDLPFEANGKNAKEVVQLLLEVAKGQAEAIRSILKTQEKLIQELKEIRLDYAEHKKTAMF